MNFEIARNEKGELKRLNDKRGFEPIIARSNYGFSKGKEMEQGRYIYIKRCQY